VRIAYDDYNLYVAFICQDDPKEIRAYLHDRGWIQNEDQVGIFIDTYDDADNAVAMFANPLGVQQDWMTADYNSDLLYSTAGRITHTGYQVEMAIPFSSLRFPNTPTQNWRINFQRIRPRGSGYVYEWAATSRDNSCLPCQFGTLTGLRDLQFDHQLELLPTLTAHDVTYFSRGSQNSRGILTTGASFVARYLPAPNITISVASAPEIGELNTSNKTIWYQEYSPWWSLLLPRAEHRLFRDDGYPATQSPFNFSHSAIEADAAAVIATGRFGRTAVTYQGGYLENDESRSESIVPNPALTNEVYVRQSLYDDSYIGASARHSTWKDGGNSSSVESAGKLRLLEHYVVWWDMGIGRTAEPVDSATWNSDSPLDGEILGGYRLTAGINHSTRHWDSQIFYRIDGAAFDPGSSPLFSTEGQSLIASTSYTIYPGISAIERIIPSITAYWSRYDKSGVEQIHVAPSILLLVSQPASVWLRYSLNQTRAQEYNNSYHSMDLSIGRSFGPRINLGISGRYAHDYENSQSTAKNLSLGLYGNVIPIPSLMIGWSLSYYERQTIQEPPQHHINWSNSISYQLIEQLSTTLGLLYDGDRLSFDPFLVYRFNAYSSISLGSTHNFQKLWNDASIFNETTRQFFLKAQYLFGV
jgi:hypothetical protein